MTLIVAFLTAFTQPCKSLSTNISLSFHLMWIAVEGVILSFYVVDIGEMKSSTKVTFVFITPIPHILMFMWLVYNVACKIEQIKTIKVFLTNVVHKLIGKKLFERHMSHVLPDRLEISQEYRQLKNSASNEMLYNN